MPVLDIAPDNLGHPLTINCIIGVMLWPQDEAERSQYMRVALAGLLTQNVREAMPPPDELDLLFELAREALPPGDMVPKILVRYHRGFRAGELLGAAVLEHARAGVVKLESLKDSMVEPKRRKAHRAMDFGRTTLEKAIWRDFKSVAPFWAAHVHFVFDEGDRRFPCPPERLSQFLSAVNFFRRAATTIRSDRRSEPLLIKKDLWVLPPGLPIERAELKLGD